MKENNDINAHREAIDMIDRELVKLLNKRASHAIAIGKLKRKINESVYDPEREKMIYDNFKKNNGGPLTANALQRLFERIIDESRRIERESSEKEN